MHLTYILLLVIKKSRSKKITQRLSPKALFNFKNGGYISIIDNNNVSSKSIASSIYLTALNLLLEFKTK